MDNETRLRQLKAKYPMAHQWATQKWNYQCGGLGREEQGITKPIDPSSNMNHQRFGFGRPSCEAASSRGTSGNNENDSLDINDMPEEVVIRAYDDIDSSSNFGTANLFYTSILLIDLPLHHPELFDWGQIVAHLDTFKDDTMLLQFLEVVEGAPYHHPEQNTVYKLDPHDYFGEDLRSSANIMKSGIYQAIGFPPSVQCSSTQL